MHLNEFAWVGTVFIGYACGNVNFIGFEKRLSHVFHACWAIHLHRLFQTSRHPSIVKQIAVFQSMVRMHVGNENVIQILQAVACFHHLHRHPIARIHHKFFAIDDNQIGRIGAFHAHTRATLCA